MAGFLRPIPQVMQIQILKKRNKFWNCCFFLQIVFSLFFANCEAAKLPEVKMIPEFLAAVSTIVNSNLPTGTGTGTGTGSSTGTTTVPTVETPAFNPSPEHYTSMQSITISSTTSGAQIYYTTNGTTPTTSSTLYSSGLNIWKYAGKTIKAIAVKAGLNDSAVASGRFSYSTLKTGQVTLYDSGDDGDFEMGVIRSYSGPTQHSTFTSDYTTTDNSTGLIWKTCSEGKSGPTCGTGSCNSGNLSSVTSWCDALNSANSGSGYAGITTWRLPSIQELDTLIDASISTPPTINQGAFPNSCSNDYWSSTLYAPIATWAWNGLFGIGDINYSGTGVSKFARCVSGQQRDNAILLADNGDGTVTDKTTGLVWQRCNSGQTNDATCSGAASTVNWSSSIIYCNGLGLAGRTWRLPNRNELMSIVDLTLAASPAINTTYFPNTGAFDYWTSTTSGPFSPGDAWFVRVGGTDPIGQVTHVNKGAPKFTRCVSGPP